MNSIDILADDPQALRGLLGIAGLILLTESFRQVDAAQYAISAFADNTAITTLRARGLIVEIVTPAADLDAHDAQVMKDLADNNP